MVNRMRQTRAHKGNRRAHHKIKGAPITYDPATNTPHLRHRASLETGRYRGRPVLNVVKQVEKKQAKQDANET